MKTYVRHLKPGRVPPRLCPLPPAAAPTTPLGMLRWCRALDGGWYVLILHRPEDAEYELAGPFDDEHDAVQMARRAEELAA